MENEDYDNIAIFIASLYTNFKSIFYEKINKRTLKQKCDETQREIKTLEDVYFDSECVETKCVETKYVETKYIETRCTVNDTPCDDNMKCDDTKCDDTKCDDTGKTVNDTICDDIYTTCDIVLKNTTIDDSWSVKYGIESVKIYHGHVYLHDYSYDTSDDDF
jgi:hypothetical protein